MQVALENNLPSNPDFWDKETLLRLIDLAYGNVDKKVKRTKIKMLRRIPQFRQWLEGLVGAEKKHVEPKTTALFYEDYLRIKELWKKGLISTEDFLVIWLHIVTGAREGWDSEITKPNDDLDNAKTSLVGLRWENLEFVADTVILKVYEHKTQKTWRCDLKWLDPEIVPIFLRYRKESGSIIKTLTKCKTVKEFERYYRRLLKRVSELLNLPFTLKPHDMRRSHISILAELGIPMEIAVSGLMDFGVGWEDLSTALIFYTRFSRYVKEKLLEEAEKRKREIEQRLKAS
jgi:Phage integrase family.